MSSSDNDSFNYLSEQTFNTTLDSISEEAELYANSLRHLPEDEQLHHMSTYLIDALLARGYTMFAVCHMLMRYQIRLGQEMARANLNHEAEAENIKREILRILFGASMGAFTITPTEHPFEP